MKTKRSQVLLTVLIGFVLLILPARAVFAAESGKTDVTVVASKGYVQSSRNNSRLLFLFASGRIEAEQEGDLYLFFSNVELRSNIKGNVYSLFSDVSVSADSNIDGEIKTLSSRVVSGSESAKISQMFAEFGIFLKTSEYNNYTVTDDSFTHVWLWMSALRITLAYLVLMIKRSFIEQGGMLLYHEPLRLIKNGIVTYVSLALAFLVFTISLLFFPFSILLAAVFFAALIAGEASLSLILGHTVTETLNSYIYGKRDLPFHPPFSRTIRSYFAAKRPAEMKVNSTACMLIGIIIIEALRNIPYISLGFSYFFFPILALGTLITALINAFVLKRYYLPVFGHGERDKKAANFEETRKKLLVADKR